MKRGKAVRIPIDLAPASEYARMLRVLFWVGFIAVLGLAHIQVRLATRDMAIQRSRFQVEREDLWNKRCALASDVARLSGGDRLLSYARDRLGLVEVPADQIRVWPMPRYIAQKYERKYTEIAARRTGADGSRPREDLLDRLLATVLSPDAQAQPASPGR